MKESGEEGRGMEGSGGGEKVSGSKYYRNLH